MLFCYLLALCSVTTVGWCLPSPSWSTAYSVTGTLVIPFAEVEEPFSAFFDASNAGKARVDFYGGMDKTFQRGDVGPYGTAFKLVPMTDEHIRNQINCFVVNGSRDEPIRPLSVLPNLDEFVMIGTDIVGGHECEKWQKKETIGGKSNKYTMWLRRIRSALSPKLSIAVPVHYEMKGYNSLLGSHYDHYYLTYENFVSDIPDSSVFDAYNISSGCHDWPGPGDSVENHRVYFVEPLSEFVQSRSDHTDEVFDRFKIAHGKTYLRQREEETRKDIFRHNVRFIHSRNRAGLSYKLAANHMTDWTSSELRQLRGKLYSPGYNGGAEFKYTPGELLSAPDSLDWRLFGAVTPVKDQTVCGSCWAFGTVGTLEGARFLNSGVLERLSQQALIDCSWGFGNNGCDGGEDFRVYQYMLRHGGIPSEEDYGPYLGNNGYCHVGGDESSIKPVFQIASYVNVTSGDPSALKVALSKHGPISVAIDASHRSLSFYSRGVYFEPACSNKPEDLDHAVLAAGYGEIEGKKYWLIKNSWSTYWGNDGYVLMAQEGNNCGVATSPTFVIPA